MYLKVKLYSSPPAPSPLLISFPALSPGQVGGAASSIHSLMALCVQPSISFMWTPDLSYQKVNSSVLQFEVMLCGPCAHTSAEITSTFYRHVCVIVACIHTCKHMHCNARDCIQHACGAPSARAHAAVTFPMQVWVGKLE